MRLFIAINFNDKTLSSLLALRDGLRSHSEAGSFSLPENLHLTLAFLGECDGKQGAAAKTAMDSLCFAPFELRIWHIGCFGGGRPGNRGSQQGRGGAIWWAGAEESKPLLELQRELTDKLISAGFILDTRKYSPHITLGRQVVTAEAPRRIEAFGETVRRIDLMKSERVNGKLTYTAIHTKLADG